MFDFISNITLFLHRILPLPWHARHQEYRPHFRHHFKLHLVTFTLATLTIAGMLIPVLLSSGKEGWEFFNYSESEHVTRYVGMRRIGGENGTDITQLDATGLPWMHPPPNLAFWPRILYYAPILNLLTFLIAGPMCWLIDYGMHVHQHHQPHDEVRLSASLFAFAMGWVVGAEAFIMYVLGRYPVMGSPGTEDIIPGIMFWLQGIWIGAAALWAYAMHHRIKKEGAANGYEPVEPNTKDATSRSETKG